MTGPKLLIDQGDEMTDRRALVGGNAHVERGRHMQTGHILAPVQRNLMIAPFARHTDGQFVLMAAFENPVTDRGYLFEKIQGICVEFVSFNDRSSHDAPRSRLPTEKWPGNRPN